MQSLLQKQANPAATAANNAGTRQPMHDDSGAMTGLRMRPDYGESDSYTTEANEANSKGASAGCIIAVETAAKLAAEGETYVSSVEFNAKNAMKMDKFSFTADRGRAMVFHNLTAAEVVRQINGPLFGAKAHIILAYNYEDMFKAVLALVPKAEPVVNRVITWAKQKLKKQDRIVWYLRWYRLALAADLQQKATSARGKVMPPVQAAEEVERDQPATDPQQAIQPQAPSAPKRQTIKQQLGALVEKYKMEMNAKMGGAIWSMPNVDDFPEINRSLEHFYSLPVPEIQNKVLTFEPWSAVSQAFRYSEEEWKEKTKALIKPHKEDKMFIKFPDGWAWWWLPRASCSDESKAMGHCGNSPMAGRKGVSILSLREPKKMGPETYWYPHLTFILHGEDDEGTLGEMKGRNNDKPVPRYHPYIIALLKDNRIKGIVGGGYLPSHNFSLEDLTEEQRKEVAKANPNIGLTIKDYYNEYGMDDNLVGRIRTILELGPDAHYDHNYGFIIHQWKDQNELISDCGDREARDAVTFIQTGKHDNDSPDEDELADLLDNVDDKHVYHAGLALQYHYPKELKEWFYDQRGDPNFNPRDTEMVKQAIRDLYEMKVKGGLKAWRKEQEEPTHPANGDEEDTDAEQAKSKKKKEVKSPYQIPVIQEFWWAYQDGGPDQDTVQEILNTKVEEALAEVGAEMEYGPAGIMQAISEDSAVEMASAEESGTSRRRGVEIEKPSISMPYDWDDWDEDRAVEQLRNYLDTPPKRPEMEKQKRLFKEPKTEEEAKKKGITISKLLKSPLFARA